MAPPSSLYFRSFRCRLVIRAWFFVMKSSASWLPAAVWWPMSRLIPFHRLVPGCRQRLQMSVIADHQPVLGGELADLPGQVAWRYLRFTQAQPSRRRASLRDSKLGRRSPRARRRTNSSGRCWSPSPRGIWELRKLFGCGHIGLQHTESKSVASKVRIWPGLPKLFGGLLGLNKKAPTV